MNIYKLYNYGYNQKNQSLIIFCENMNKAVEFYKKIYNKDPLRIKQLNTIQDKVLLQTKDQIYEF